jgi:hypothetical protein
MRAHLPIRRHSRRTLAIVAAFLGLAALIPASASAVVITSITSPANNATVFVDQAQSGSSATALTVTGSSNAAVNVDVDCSSWDGGAVAKFVTAKPVSIGSFAIPVTYAELSSAAAGVIDGPCRLSVVPTGSTPPDPGATNSLATGPVISISYEQLVTQSSVPYDFYAQYTGAATGSAGSLEFTSPADCGLEDSWIDTGTATLTESAGAFDCMGSFFAAYTSGESSSVHAPQELDVDGKAAALADTFLDATTAPGYESPTITDSFSGSELTVHDDEPVMLCASACSNSSPPAAGYQASGITLDRTWQTEDNGLVVLQTDAFTSTDGAAHTVTALEDDDFNKDSSANESADFPGTPGFAEYQPGSTISGVSGPGAIYFKTNATTPDSGDTAMHWPQGAIAYAKAPSGPIVVTYWTNSGGQWTPEFYLPYTLQVPAAGTAALRFAYVQDFALGDVQTLAQQAIASFHPTLTVTAPSNGATLPTPQTVISGTATDTGAIQSVTVNGGTAILGSGGAFSESVDLPVGANTITVVAADADGLTATQTASVTIAKQRTNSLSTKIRAGKRHTYKLTGKLTLPAGVSVIQGCSGRIAVTAKRGRKKVGSASAKLGAKCGWSAKFTAKRLKGHGKLKVTVAFKGNVAINPFTPRALTAKY